MARAKGKPDDGEQSVTLTYGPLTLPTAQHRAGLAGLMVLEQALRQRRDDGVADVGPLPEISKTDDPYEVRVTLTLDGLQTLFNELFDAGWAEVRAKNAPKADPTKPAWFKNLHEEEIPPSEPGGKPTKQYVYEVLAPKGGFWDDLGPAEDADHLWRKLWRDAIWATLRGRPKSRLPYEQRRDKKPVEQAGKLWKDLTHRKLGTETPTDFSEALLIGAQSMTADGVPFEGSARETLLLYFWPVVALVGQARISKIEREQGGVRAKDEDAGFVFTVPDVAEPWTFARRFKRVLGSLETKGAGYRPATSIWALPQEGGLEYLHHLLNLAADQAESSQLADAVTGFEIYQLMKRGNNIPLLAVGRIPTSEGLAHKYAAVRSQYWSPIFRAQRLLNLLRDHVHGDVPWYRDFGNLFERYPWEVFVGGEASGRFAHDAGQELQQEAERRRRQG